MVTETLEIGSRRVGPGCPCYLVAEVGTTCLGDPEAALSLIRIASDAGADAVKFQLIDPFQDSRPDQSYAVEWNGTPSQVNMRDMFSRLEFSPAQWSEISKACSAVEIAFLCTVDFVDGVDLLETLGVTAHKVGAWDATYRPLIERIGHTGKPMLVDLGPTTLGEIDALTQWYKEAGGPDVIFLHDYHTDDPEQMNMRAIEYLRSTQGAPVGYSSPNRGHDLDFVALALGANLIEKRLILDRNLQAFHSHESLEPDEFADWVNRVRRAEAAFGEPAIKPSKKDRSDALNYYRSVCTLTPVQRGEQFTERNIGGRRPGSGIDTSQLRKIIGRHAARDLPENTLLKPGDIQ